jgi:tetratricopeptide (TPR) repeat protein
MMNDLQLDLLLDRFHEGSASREEVDESFVANSVSNGEALIQQHRSAIRALEQYNLLIQVQQVHQTFLQNRKQSTAIVRTIKPMVYFRRIAAVLVIALSCLTIFQYSNSSTEQLYKELHSTYTLSELRGEDATAATDLVKAFRKADYKQTIALFQVSRTTGNRERFFTAISYLETGEPEKAIPLFEQIEQFNQKNGEQLYQDETDYYAALALLKTADRKKAVVLLQKIQADQEHTYHRYVSKWMIWKIKWLGHKGQ